MKVTLTIPDELFETYQGQTGFGTTVQQTIVSRLVAYAEADPKERPIIVTRETRQRLEDILESTIESPKAIAELCERLATIDLGEVGHTLSVDELERLRSQARFFGESVDEYLERTLGEFVRYALNLA